MLHHVAHKQVQDTEVLTKRHDQVMFWRQHMQSLWNTGAMAAQVATVLHFHGGFVVQMLHSQPSSLLLSLSLLAMLAHHSATAREAE